MVKPRQLICLTISFFLSHLACAQEEVEMADTMRSNGKIYVIVGIILVVLIGFILYLFTLDRKISRLEKEIHDKEK